MNVIKKLAEDLCKTLCPVCREPVQHMDQLCPECERAKREHERAEAEMARRKKFPYSSMRGWL